MAVHATLIAGIPKIVKSESSTQLRFPSGYVDDLYSADEILRVYVTLLADHAVNMKVLGHLMHRIAEPIDFTSLSVAIENFGNRLLSEIDLFENISRP
jgi:hypothetical protein